MAAVISNQGGFYSTFAYVSEARRMGLAILLPDLNESDWAYRGEGERLRMGFMQIKTIPKELGEKIVEERKKNGPYRSFQDFLQRVKPESAQARSLVRAGCCDSIAGELTRPALMWRLYVGSDATAGPLPIPDNYSAAQKRAHEIESFGFLASRHPLTLYRHQIERLRPVPASHMHQFVGQCITMAGVLITEKSVETKQGQAMGIHHAGRRHSSIRRHTLPRHLSPLLPSPLTKPALRHPWPGGRKLRRRDINGAGSPAIGADMGQ